MITKCVIVGTGKLPFLCAREMRKFVGKILICEFGAYRQSLLELQCNKTGLNYSRVDKKMLTQFLMSIEENTLIISANNTYIFPPQILLKDNFRIINFHPALLPEHPGRNAEAWAIFDEDNRTGVTWHWVDCEIDHGSVIIQKSIPLDTKITALKLMIKQINTAFEIFQQILPDILKKSGEPISICPQCEAKRYSVHLSKERPNNGNLDIAWSLSKISAFLRAMDYGGLEVLGKPYCVIEQRRYLWSGYSIDKNIKKISCDINRGVFADADMVIRLKNFRRMRENEENNI